MRLIALVNRADRPSPGGDESVVVRARPIERDTEDAGPLAEPFCWPRAVLDGNNERIQQYARVAIRRGAQIPGVVVNDFLVAVPRSFNVNDANFNRTVSLVKIESYPSDELGVRHEATGSRR